MASEEHLLFEIDEGVGIVTLNRPNQLDGRRQGFLFRGRCRMDRW